MTGENQSGSGVGSDEIKEGQTTRTEETNNLPDGVGRTIEGFLRDVLARDGVPGLSVAIVDRDRTLYAKGIGARDISTNAPATPQTLFGIGSSTKSVTALVTLSLAEDNLLSLSDSVIDYLPIAFDEAVTLHHLLSHTSGAPSNGMANTLLSRLTGVGDTRVPMAGRGDFLAHVNEAIEDGISPPDERFFYYASGFTLLGMIVETVTDRSYPEVVADRVFAPLGMSRSTFDRKAFEADTDRMTPYVPADDRDGAAGYEPASFPSHDLIDPTGGLLAPVSELTDYVRLLLNEGIVNGTRVVTAESVDQMATAHAALDGEMGAEGYGYALMIDEVAGHRLVGHSGDAVVSSGYLGYLPDAGYGVAVGCNTSPPFKLNRLGAAILAGVIGEDPYDSVPYFGQRKRMAALEGIYEAHRGTKRIRVVAEGARLVLEVESMTGASTRVPLRLLPSGTESGDESSRDQRPKPAAIIEQDGGDPSEGPLDSGRATFEAIQTSATPTTVTFDTSGEVVDLYMERYRLRRQELGT